MKKTFALATLALLSASIFVISCKKKDDTTPDFTLSSEINSVTDDLDDALKVSEGALNTSSVLRTDDALASGCSSITHDATNKKITINFGTGCLGNDGRLRSGRLFITYTGTYRTSGTVVTIKTENYFVNGKKVDARRTVTNTSSNVNGPYTFTVVDTDSSGVGYAKITNETGGITTWKSTRFRKWAAGYTTLANIYDDEYIITGTGEGISSKGVAYTLNASEVTVNAACWASKIFVPVSGTLSITTSDGTRSLDYGGGTCDHNAQYTHTNGKTYSVVIY